MLERYNKCEGNLLVILLYPSQLVRSSAAARQLSSTVEIQVFWIVYPTLDTFVYRFSLKNFPDETLLSK